MNFQILESKKAMPLAQFGGTAMGYTYEVSNRYLTRDGKPFVYRMGEMHFSRVPKKDWEKELIKMRDGGIEIVASYLFWIHHEEEEGVYRFDDNCDLRAFLMTCKKVGLPFFLRLGPWAHGEARNGGLPDWVLQKCGGKEHTRTNEEPYLSFVRRYFTRVFEEIHDCMDVVVGIQVENELHFNIEHMTTLYHMIREIGFSAPILTATGWGPGGCHANVPKDLLIPLYGGYPDAPWAMHIEPIKGSDNFHFSHNWNSSEIGTDIFGTDGEKSKASETVESSQGYPYLTCEVGGGNQVTYHRRPIISSADICAGVICRLGSGANGIGYYMYHGGKNPIGKTTMQESRATKYKNDYPIISYDFQSPLGECGQLRESYFELRSIHDFLACCGEILAPMPSTLPAQRPADSFDTTTLRCAVRSDGRRGFLFFNNHIHAESMPDQCEIVQIEPANGEKVVEIPLNVPTGAYGVIPFRFPIGNVVAEWITAMPVSITENQIVFEKIKGVEAQICLQNGEIYAMEQDLTIGGVQIVLRETKAQLPELGTRVEVSQMKHTLPNTDFAHIENRDGTPLVPVSDVDYLIQLTRPTSYLAIRAFGNAAALYGDGKLLADFYLYGDTWIVDLREVDPKTELVLKVLPLNEENKKNIYFEMDMPIGVHAPEVYEFDI